MLSFLQPGYWIALAGLLIPLAIHLWNRRKGRTIKVGSIQFLEQAEEKRLKRIKLSDKRRLLLRMLLLGCFVFLLVRPVWKIIDAGKENQKWVLVGQDYWDQPDLIAIVDSLNQEGFEIKAFTAHFPGLENVQKNIQPDNYWSLLKEIAALPNPPDSLFIIARPGQQYFRGSRPKLNIPVQWKTLPLHSPNPFLAQAWKKDDTISLLIGQSTESGTSYQIEKLPFTDQKKMYLLEGFPEINIRQNFAANQREVYFADQVDNKITLQDTFQLEATILFGPEFEQDKTYLEAALKAVGQYLELAVDVETQPIDVVPTHQSGWLFWLSKAPIADTLRKTFSPNLAIFSPQGINKKSYFSKAEGEYHLEKRFTPGIAVEAAEQLPHDLISLLFELSHQKAVKYATHAYDLSQVLPVMDNGKIVNATNPGASKPLFWSVWILLMLLFVLERLW